MVAYNLTRATVIATRVGKADDADSRSLGLLGRSSLERGEGLWIIPCPMIHTFFMKFPIDVVFLDRRQDVVRVVEDLRPWRLSPWVWRAHSALELAGGSLHGAVARGDRIEFRATGQ